MSQEFDDFFGLIPQASDEDDTEWLQKDPKNLLLAELYLAEKKARRGGKRGTMDTHRFEINLFENLMRLRDALCEGFYYPSRGTVHIIFDPVQREIFAAPYRDRVLHHWVVDTIMEWWEPRLWYDSCSCRKDKGTFFGIKRMKHHILSVSEGMTKPAYVIQLDISGYFMHIDREILYGLVVEGLNKQFPPEKRNKRYTILREAICGIIFDNPIDGVRLQGTYSDWIGLPENKSLMFQPDGRGLVIGNYTSQTFSNIYLNPLDRFITMTLGWKHYGRYVDDFYYVVSEEDLPQAKRDIEAIRKFLNGYGLELNKKKTRITEVHKGVKFLGAVVRGHQIFPGKRIVKNFREAARLVVAGEKDPDVITSYLGMLSHFDAGKVIRKVFDSVGWEYVYDKKRKM
ncbi:RNA-directed DNA polymerase [Candidatus Saccharibacteria bacterium]|nr:RNA-directed DNA polymerase [Candidatus Saccharibacteria bacterium]